MIFRLYIRLRLSRRLTVDDYFITAAWSSSVAIGILWKIRSEDEIPFFGYPLEPDDEFVQSDWLAEIVHQYYSSLLATYVTQTIGLWCVKFSLLFFFRQLGTNVRKQMILWWCVCAFIVASFVVCVGNQHYQCLTVQFPKSIGMLLTIESIHTRC